MHDFSTGDVLLLCINNLQLHVVSNKCAMYVAKHMHRVIALMYTHMAATSMPEFSASSMPSGLTKPLLRAGLSPAKLGLD